MRRDHKGTTILSFVIGAGVGAAAALFLAPKAGEELRADIADGVNDGINQVRSKGKELKQRAQKFVDLTQNQVQDAMDSAQDAYSNAKKV
jgi:gas vesicle protein